jgi:hypothetical protein
MRIYTHVMVEVVRSQELETGTPEQSTIEHADSMLWGTAASRDVPDECQMRESPMSIQYDHSTATTICRSTMLAAMLMLSPGCGPDSPENPETVTSGGTPADAGQTDSGAASGRTPTSGSTSKPDDEFDFAPIGLSSLAGEEQTTEATVASASVEQQMRSVIQRLQPLQVLLGQWRGTTRREYDGFKAVDSHNWIWDLQTDPARPALQISSDKSPYLRDASISWDFSTGKFVLTAIDAEGIKRILQGDFTDPVHEVIGDDDKLHRVYRLRFTQPADADPGDSGEFWQIAISQQENNRYLLEVDKRRGTAAFRRFDTVSTQREGTSFAINDSDYGDKTCIISEGLGTTEIVYNGRSYWVCCSGCKAAFEEDPEKWIAIAAKRDQEKKEAVNANP